MQKVVASRCCGCKGTGAAKEDDEETPVEVDLLEAKEHSVNLAIRAPKPPTRTGIGFIAPALSSKTPTPNLELLVSVMGGPYSDINGPVEERVGSVNYGARLIHEVRNLHPETEYTITVTFKAVPQPQQSDGAPLLPNAASSAASTSSGKSAHLEVRTAAPSTATFAGEDWSATAAAHRGDPPTKGNYSKSAYCHDPKAGRKAATGGASASSSSAAAAAAARQQDETSTIAPSDAGGDPGRLDSVSDSEEEGDGNGSPPRVAATAAVAASSSSAPQATPQGGVYMGDEGPSGLDVVEVTNVLEASSASRTTSCNLCSMMDCMKQRPRGDEGEVVIQRASAKKAAAAAKKKQWRPYRTPFPGTPVDPASVGLSLPPEVPGPPA